MGGYVFPLNLVWPLRSPDWYDVLQALRNSEAAQIALSRWYTPEVFAKVDSIHNEFPRGFQFSWGKLIRNKSLWMGALDLRAGDVANFAHAQIRKARKRRWNKICKAMILFAKQLQSIRTSRSMDGTMMDGALMVGTLMGQS